MKFVDEATIEVQAGKGGDGCLSFRRERFIPRGGPDGGDGGDGAKVFLLADEHINTLVEFRYRRIHKAGNGQPGMGNNRRGKSAEDLVIHVPVGTAVYDADTDELIGDLTEQDQTLCVAKGGFHGLGNARYKSSTNRTPRQTSKGTPGEYRRIYMELKLLADVGLLGLPNAGKSTLINAVSNAKPKVADYPFTTLVPMLGVVRVESFKSFVIADIPGLIEGASEGAGLGIQFLKHLSRCGLLLHVIDIAPLDESDPVEAYRAIENEIVRYSEELGQKERWLVFNKIDLLPEDEMKKRCDDIVKEIGWTGPVFYISAISKQGTQQLCYDIMKALENAGEGGSIFDKEPWE